MQLIGAGVLYFILTYSAGFVFGALRETFVVPRLGQLSATLIETPLMLAVTYLAAHFVIGRMVPLPPFIDRAVIGGIAFALLIAAEIIFAGLLRGWSFGQWLAHLKTADGAISAVLFLLFAVMPLAVRRG